LRWDLLPGRERVCGSGHPESARRPLRHVQWRRRAYGRLWRAGRSSDCSSGWRLSLSNLVRPLAHVPSRRGPAAPDPAAGWSNVPPFRRQAGAGRASYPGSAFRRRGPAGFRHRRPAGFGCRRSAFRRRGPAGFGCRRMTRPRSWGSRGALAARHGRKAAAGPWAPRWGECWPAGSLTGISSCPAAARRTFARPWRTRRKLDGISSLNLCHAA